MRLPTTLVSLALPAITIAAPLQQRQAPSEVPDYVLKYAPIARLFTKEEYNPADISTQLANTHPSIHRDATSGPEPLTLDNLNDLNNIADSGSPGGSDIYLTSDHDPTTDPRPQYLYGVFPNEQGKTESAISSAIITVQKENNTLDAFYFYFYAFDYGGRYFFNLVNAGNHVGDWEHTMVRFVDGVPQAIWYSQHASGEAFEYGATKKYDGGDRPVVYVAEGTHANYATPGTHAHDIPGHNTDEGLLEDHTDSGALWDPVQSAYFYSYDVADKSFTSYGDAPVNWLYFTGHWGDDKIPENDKRQHCVLGADFTCRYVAGPTGPAFKGLDRKEVCPDGNEGGCDVLSKALPKRSFKRMERGGERWDDMSL